MKPQRNIPSAPLHAALSAHRCGFPAIKCAALVHSLLWLWYFFVSEKVLNLLSTEQQNVPAKERDILYLSSGETLVRKAARNDAYAANTSHINFILYP